MSAIQRKLTIGFSFQCSFSVFLFSQVTPNFQRRLTDNAFFKRQLGTSNKRSWVTTSVIDCIPCPLKIHVQILTSNVMLLEVGAFGKGIGHEGRTLMNEISILIKETSKSSLAPSTTRKHSKKSTVYEPGSRPTPNPKSADALILDLSASITVRNKFLLLLNHPGYILILCL